jgi:S-adenosylmethionine decarboxylase proenzyme
MLASHEVQRVNSAGQHVLAEYHGCDPATLDDQRRLEEFLHHAAQAAGATVVSSSFHRFSPHGVTGVVVLEESHMSIHTWPERGYAAVDFFTCGDCQPERAHHHMFAHLGARHAEVLVVRRGATPATPSMHVDEHYRESATPDASGDAAGSLSPRLPDKTR